MTPDPRIGITTTVPIEIIYAAGAIPVDLNNLFAASPAPAADLDRAEREGFPRAFCAWTKGIYSTVHRHSLRRIIGVTVGDCSDAHALLDLLRHEGLEVIPFAYPVRPDTEAMREALADLGDRLGVPPAAARAQKERLDQARRLAHAVDRAAWTHGTVTGTELFATLIQAADFCGNPEAYAERCQALLDAARQRPQREGGPRLGFVGIPPVFTDINAVLEAAQASVVYHELPRQFALPTTGASLEESYTRYTYPYSFAERLADIAQECRTRALDGLVHYVQSFCHRQVIDRLLRKRVRLPVLTLEGDRPGPVDARTRTRLEAFLEALVP